MFLTYDERCIIANLIYDRGYHNIPLNGICPFFMGYIVNRDAYSDYNEMYNDIANDYIITIYKAA